MRKQFTLLTILLVLSVLVKAQTWSGSRLLVRDNITLNYVRVDSIVNDDTVGWRYKMKTIPTASAIWKFINGRISGSGSTYTFTNGITESGGTVKLGGALVNNTSITNPSGYSFDIHLNEDNDMQGLIGDTYNSFIGFANGSTLMSASNGNSSITLGNPIQIVSSGATTSSINVSRDNVSIYPNNGKLYLDSLNTVSSTTGRKVLVHDTATGKVERVDPSAFGGWGLSGNTITAGANYIGTNNNASFRIHTNNTLTAWFDSLQGRLHLVNGTDPLVSMKQATTNQTWQMRVGHNTGIASSQFNIYDATSGKVRMVINGSGNVGIGTETNIPGVSQLYVYGGQTGGNIDARGDSTSEARDEANIEVEHPDYDGVSHTAYGVAMQVNGNVTTGSLLTYPKKNSGQLRFTNETNIIRVIPNRSLRFATNNIERAVLDSNGRLGVGTKLPDSLFHIKGGLRIENGTQGAGKVLTSDANGGASWQTPTSGTVYVDSVYINGSNDSLIVQKNGNRYAYLIPSGGGSSGLTIGTTTITGSVSGSIPYDSAGVLRRNDKLFWDRTNNILRLGGTLSENPTIKFTSTDNSFSTDFSIYRRPNASPSPRGLTFYNDGSGDVMTLSRSAKVGILTTDPKSTFDVVGSHGKSITTTTANLTLDETHHTVIITSGTPTITLPAASGVTRREYRLVNQTGSAVTISTYKDFAGADATTITANSSMVFQNNGTIWYRVQ